MYINIVSLTPWKAWILSYQFAWNLFLARLPKVGLTLQVENSFVLSMVQNSFVLLMWVYSPFLVDIQITYCHIEQLVQWPDLMLKGLARWVVSPSHHLITQIGTNLWTLLHPWNIASQLPNSDAYTTIERDPWQKDRILMLDVHFFVKISKGGIKLFKKCFKVIVQGWLMFQQMWNQTKVVLNNKMLMNPTWAGLVGYWWGWS